MEIVVTGRNSEISESFRTHVEEKLERINKFDESQRIHRVDVEVTHAKNPRQRETAATVEVTLVCRGPDSSAAGKRLAATTAAPCPTASMKSPKAHRSRRSHRLKLRVTVR